LKRQEAEHTVVIRKIVQDLEEKFTEKLDEYQKILSATEATILQYIETLNRSGYVILLNWYKKLQILLK